MNSNGDVLVFHGHNQHCGGAAYGDRLTWPAVLEIHNQRQSGPLGLGIWGGWQRDGPVARQDTV